MGMQVAGTHEVERITCGVSASLELFERAVGAGAQLLLVHHGLLWDNDPRVVDDAMRRRLKVLLDSGITLAAYHLALDAHAELGNNALLARELGIDFVAGGHYATERIGIQALARRLAEQFGLEWEFIDLPNPV